jgi:uncharacterized membrane protein
LIDPAAPNRIKNCSIVCVNIPASRYRCLCPDGLLSSRQLRCSASSRTARCITDPRGRIITITIGCIPALIIIAEILAFKQSGAEVFLPSIFSLLTLSGCLVAILLLWYELDQHNPVLQQICSAGKKINCGAVLQSKASKILGISWSAIGFS